ncbi:hypothetical protein ILUMI_16571 [Ignelater luminosus]|uniref:Single domain-containing protein n=1 Tax=Ignelater luminosus TaxID=2038154 RepID=A0A8K0G5U8_IGNLU|nr:hypothetical protein ILUMI_16571 [Ignelater luminosus]
MNYFLFVFILVTLSVLNSSAESGKKECIDVETNKTYGVGESWVEKGKCSKYACLEAPVPNLPNVHLPTITRYICTEPAPPDGDTRNCHALVPYPNDPYPKCCKHLICNRPGYQQILKPKYN